MKNEFNSSVGNKIKEIRKAMGLTQKQLAEQAGVSPVTIQQYERGLREPRTDKLKAIASVLQVTMQYLVDADPVRIIPDDVRLSDEEVKKEDELTAFSPFSRELGYRVDLEIADGGTEVYFTVTEIATNSSYFISETDLRKVCENVAAFTKFQWDQVLSSKEKLKSCKPI